MIRSLVITLAFVLISVASFAADTATINVSATVQETCTFGAATYAMAFGVIDPTGTGDVTANTAIDFTCNTTNAITLDDVSGAYLMAGSGANTLAYDIDAYAIPTNGTGALQTVNLVGRVADTAYSVAVADVYTDSVTINILP